jgi:hypothetical protein
MRKSIVGAAALAITLCANAVQAGIIDEDKLQYRDWGGAKPNVITFISSKVPLAWTYYSRYDVTWLDMQSGLVESMQSRVCEMVNSSTDNKCKGPESPMLTIKEAFLGTPEDFRAHPAANVRSNKMALGVDQLADLPPGAKRIIQMGIRELNNLRMVISVAYDDISDDDLRTIALEDGVYRVMRWRSN